MKVFRSLGEIPASFGSTVVSVGNFDGVHLAHQHVLQQVVQRARELGAKSLAVTFEPHPVRILRPDVAPKLITPLPIKLKLLETTGLDGAVVIPFSRDFSITSPRDFAGEILARHIKAKEVHEGANFHFGHKAQGNVQKLTEFGKQHGFEVKVYPEMRIRGAVVSSSQVRELLRAGDVSRAQRLLGRAFSVVAHPGRGRGYGHKYTVPTINLTQYEELAPGDGVYITRTRIGEEQFDSVTNIGNRPTFGEPSFAIETHLLHFHEVELSPETEVEICFLRRLRGEIKFPSVDALRAQIARDVTRARRYFHLLDRR